MTLLACFYFIWLQRHFVNNGKMLCMTDLLIWYNATYFSSVHFIQKSIEMSIWILVI